MELGSGLNTAYTWTHEENSFQADDHEDLFNYGFEGAADLDAEKFASVIIEDRQTLNGRGHHPGYELQPLRTGVGRHLKNAEEWTLHDVWVTRFQGAAEYASTFGTNGWRPPDEYLLGDAVNKFGVYNHESIQDQDLVLWHITSAHHEPHDEDQAASDPNGDHSGITLIHWSGFDLVPHNVFDTNPLGGPHRSLCNGPQ
jgi:Cu2+-containing amine oxidase